MKIIFTVILSLCWKPENVPLPVNGYFKTQSNNKQEDQGKCIWQTHPDIWQLLKPTQHKTSFPDENTAPISQENQLWGTGGWFPEGNQWPWARMAGSDTTESAGDRQSNINTLPAVLPRKIKITWGVTGEKSPAKTYLKPKYCLIQSCSEGSSQQYYSALGSTIFKQYSCIATHEFQLFPRKPYQQLHLTNYWLLGIIPVKPSLWQHYSSRLPESMGSERKLHF